MNEPKSLHQIIFEVLEQYSDSNLNSDIDKAVIADEICKLYFDETEIQLDETYTDNINIDSIQNIDIIDDNFINFGD